jgi:hypothetical protein
MPTGPRRYSSSTVAEVTTKRQTARSASYPACRAPIPVRAVCPRSHPAASAMLDPSHWRGARCTIATPDQLRELWDDIVHQVVDVAGLTLGVHLSTPKQVIGEAETGSAVGTASSVRQVAYADDSRRPDVAGRCWIGRDQPDSVRRDPLARPGAELVSSAPRPGTFVLDLRRLN